MACDLKWAAYAVVVRTLTIDKRPDAGTISGRRSQMRPRSANTSATMALGAALVAMRAMH